MTNIVEDFKDMDTYDLFEYVIQTLIDMDYTLQQDRSGVQPIEIEDLQSLVADLEERYMKETGMKG